jgi:hypothetical protein
LIVIGLACALGASLSAAVLYMTATALLAALITTMAGSMSKLGLDAVIQRDVSEDVRNSAFARSETALQLAWVVGGAFGLLPMPGWLGFALGTIVMIVALTLESASLRRAHHARRVERGRVGGRGDRMGSLTEH